MSLTYKKMISLSALFQNCFFDYNRTCDVNKIYYNPLIKYYSGARWKEGLKLELWCTKKVVYHSLGLMDFALRLVNSVLNLRDKQVKFLGDFNLQKNYNQS